MAFSILEKYVGTDGHQSQYLGNLGKEGAVRVYV
jgi:hypothetical protein